MTHAKSRIALSLMRLAGHLPLNTARRLGGFMGLAAYMCHSRARRVTEANLAMALPHLDTRQRARITRLSLIETGKVGLEMCVIWYPRGKPVSAYVRNVEGEALALSALAEGKGLLVLGPHLGNWEILGQHLTHLGPVTSLFQPPKLAALYDYMLAGRQRCGAQLVPTNAKGVAAILKALKHNGISGVLPDQVPNEDSSGLFAPFFGQPAFTMVLAYKLIQRTGCKAVFAFARRVPDGFDIVYREPPAELYHPDALTATTALNQGVEALVMEAPEQYQWEYKRFKKMPDASQRPIDC